MKTTKHNFISRVARAFVAARCAFAVEWRKEAGFPEESAGAQLLRLGAAVSERVVNCSTDACTVWDSDGRQFERDLYRLHRSHNTKGTERAVQSYETWRKEMVSAFGAQAFELAAAHNDFRKGALQIIALLEERKKNE